MKPKTLQTDNMKKIISVIAMCGEVSTDIYKTMRMSRSNFYSAINGMMEEHVYITNNGRYTGILLKKRDKGSKGVYTFTQGAIEDGLSEEYGALDYFEKFSLPVYKSPVKYRSRTLNLSRAIMMFIEAEIPVLPPEKYLSEINNSSFSELNLYPQSSVFYTTKEIKSEQSVDGQTGNIAYGQCLGLYCGSNNMNYAVYPIPKTDKNGRLVWFKKAEERTQRLFRSFLNRNRYAGRSMEIDSAIYIGQGYKPLFSILKCEASHFGTVYKNEYYLSYDGNPGLLALYQQDLSEINAEMFRGCKTKGIFTKFADFEKNGIYILDGIKMNIKKALRFRQQVNKDPEQQYAVFCLTEQKAAYRKMLGSHVRIVDVETAQYIQNVIEIGGITNV